MAQVIDEKGKKIVVGKASDVVVPNKNGVVSVADLNAQTNGSGVKPNINGIKYNPGGNAINTFIDAISDARGMVEQAAANKKSEDTDAGGYNGDGASYVIGNSGAVKEPSAAESEAAPSEAAAEYAKMGYDPAADAAYQQALAALREAEQNAPQYTPSYDAQLNDIYSRIMNRDKFSYDLNADALYQQMKDQYIQQGRIAMMDTMGQQAALNGGYGSSYAQAVGQQAFNSYLQQLNNNIPEYYDRAYQQYQNEGNDLLRQYEMTGDLAERERQYYNEDYNRWLNERDYANSAEQLAYNRGLTDWQMQYDMQQDMYSRIANLIATYGYEPTDAEIAAAGLTRAQVDAMLPQVEEVAAGGGGGGGGGGGYTQTASANYTKSDYVSAYNQALSAGDDSTADAIYQAYKKDAKAYNGQDLGSANSKEFEYWKNIAG